MKIAVVGSRMCADLTVETIIDHLPKNCSTIISGGASGVDQLAKEAARRLKISYEEYKPNYGLFGKTAPIVRNREIVSNADEVIAFWDWHSNGTRNSILEALKQEKPIKIYIIEDGRILVSDENGFKGNILNM